MSVGGSYWHITHSTLQAYPSIYIIPMDEVTLDGGELQEEGKSGIFIDFMYCLVIMNDRMGPAAEHKFKLACI